jgi:hypothetical protein
MYRKENNPYSQEIISPGLPKGFQHDELTRRVPDFESGSELEER